MCYSGEGIIRDLPAVLQEHLQRDVRTEAKQSLHTIEQTTEVTENKYNTPLIGIWTTTNPRPKQHTPTKKKENLIW